MHWDIFCRVVDNYGDIGVCWRLARQLVAEHSLNVRLWVDDFHTFSKICPEITANEKKQFTQGVEIRHWPADFSQENFAPVGDVVIEAFACDLPDEYLKAMAIMAQPPFWINLEYLSAEDWIEEHHGLVSPHPQYPLVKYFFFPGFGRKSGGLLREKNYDGKRNKFNPSSFIKEFNLPAKKNSALWISLFTYQNKALSDLLSVWASDTVPIVCLLPAGQLSRSILSFFNRSHAHPGEVLTKGNLTLQLIPFVPQERYDELLWLCDLNFVRGEDSFVRAQWAEKPFVWHIYPQTEDDHHRKLSAFLVKCLPDNNQDNSWAQAVKAFWWAWERGENIATQWPNFRSVLPLFSTHLKAWSSQLQRAPDLASALVSFVDKPL